MAARAETSGEALMDHLQAQLLGQTVGGKYRLAQHIRSDAVGELFLANAGDETVDVVLTATSANNAERQLARWREIAGFSHPNLIKVVDTGKAKLAGADYFFAITEHADENLAEILPERKLSGEEGAAIAKALADALAYLHARAYEHGQIVAGNVLAVGDNIKLSSLPAHAAGKPMLAGTSQGAFGREDVRQLGELVKEAVGEQGRPLPDVLNEVVEHCLTGDGERQWSAQEIAEFVGSGTRPVRQAPVPPKPAEEVRSKAVPAEAELPAKANPVEEPGHPNRKKPVLIGVILAVLLAIGIAVTPHIARKKSAPANGATEVTPSAQTTTPPAPPSAAETQSAAPEQTTPGTPNEQVVTRVMPEVSRAALATITGKVSVSVDLHVNSNGEVEQARLGSAGPSHYFAEKALAAAKQWKFAADTGTNARTFALHFTFRRGGVDTAITRK